MFKFIKRFFTRDVIRDGHNFISHRIEFSEAEGCYLRIYYCSKCKLRGKTYVWNEKGVEIKFSSDNAPEIYYEKISCDDYMLKSVLL
jgi:hypothetical protein